MQGTFDAQVFLCVWKLNIGFTQLAQVFYVASRNRVSFTDVFTVPSFALEAFRASFYFASVAIKLNAAHIE